MFQKRLHVFSPAGILCFFVAELPNEMLWGQTKEHFPTCFNKKDRLKWQNDRYIAVH